ncbi:MAG: homoserine dehydrogenase [Firmicutes bacterium]|nr:homoserine dehydrogenase [Bacillota bacterium]MCM1400757.1 homoserine dehydrogenase [Bacteroides sp.]MCM1477604.1 homoserine dehydrogenase [Bacteroides sp.]
METINIGLFGFGVVGQGIYKVIERATNAHAKIRRVCVRDINKPRSIKLPERMLTDRAETILNDPDIDLVVEVVDDANASYRIVTDALRRRIPVVSGSKAMIARHLPELIALQRKYGTALLYDASSCGSIPVIRNLEEYYDNDLLLEVKGILNGSSNYILSRVFDHGEDYSSALARAQQLGFAESDPSFDIEGYDSLFKLIIITVHALGVYVEPEQIFTYGIATISDSDIRYAREKSMKIKLVAQVVKVDPERFTMFVMPEFVSPSKYIYSVDDEYNGVVIRGECYDRQFMFGKGAGSLPTASSILSDVMARRHGYSYEYKKMEYLNRPAYSTDVDLKIYLRFSNPEVLEQLPFKKISEQYSSENFNYVIGEISLSQLIEHRQTLNIPGTFVANIPRFFLDLD